MLLWCYLVQLLFPSIAAGSSGAASHAQKRTSAHIGGKKNFFFKSWVLILLYSERNCVARPSAAMALTWQDKSVRVFRYDHLLETTCFSLIPNMFALSPKWIMSMLNMWVILCTYNFSMPTFLGNKPHQGWNPFRRSTILTIYLCVVFFPELSHRHLLQQNHVWFNRSKLYFCLIITTPSREANEKR